MSYINKLDKYIKDFEGYEEDFPDKKFLIKYIIAVLNVLREEYFKEK